MDDRKPPHRALVNDQVLRMRERGFVKPREAAERAGISLPRIYALMDAGKLLGENVGSRRYVAFSSLLAYFGELVRRDDDEDSAPGPIREGNA